jgi:hypothetical protein
MTFVEEEVMADDVKDTPNKPPEPAPDKKDALNKPPESDQGKNEKHLRNRQTVAGPRVEYSGGEKIVAGLLVVYLLAILLVGLWLIWDIFVGRLSWFQGMLPAGATDATKAVFILLLLVAVSGWVGGALSAMNSLMGHYAATVENVGNLKQQEKNRFHIEWGGRWFWGPWIGAGLSVIVLALVRSGVLVFASSSADPTGSTVTEKFAAIGLGGLVGLGAKDVVDKLIATLKTYLRTEEAPVGELEMEMEGGKKDIKYGETATFVISPKIAVVWTLDPADPTKSGAIKNGVYVAPETAPADAPQARIIVVTATSLKDANRAASMTLVLTK